MLVLYLIAVIVGGVLVTLSIFSGADGHSTDHDVGGHDAGHSLGDDGDGGGDHIGAADALLSWLPVASLRFWIFFAAFFGLTGTALTVLGAAGPIATAVASVALGYASGLLLTRSIRALTRSSSDSSVGEGDLIGATALILVPVAAGRTGKVRLELKARSIDLLAETEEAGEMAAGERVLVIAAPRAGHVVVARAGRLT
jgi:membrane protein implicated in regulation of membrane protease activity